MVMFRFVAIFVLLASAAFAQGDTLSRRQPRPAAKFFFGMTTGEAKSTIEKLSIPIPSQIKVVSIYPSIEVFVTDDPKPEPPYTIKDLSPEMKVIEFGDRFEPTVFAHRYIKFSLYFKNDSLVRMGTLLYDVLNTCTTPDPKTFYDTTFRAALETLILSCTDTSVHKPWMYVTPYYFSFYTYNVDIDEGGVGHDVWYMHKQMEMIETVLPPSPKSEHTGNREVVVTDYTKPSPIIHAKQLAFPKGWRQRYKASER